MTTKVLIVNNDTGKYLRSGHKDRFTGRWVMRWTDEGYDAAEYTTSEASKLIREIDDSCRMFCLGKM